MPTSWWDDPYSGGGAGAVPSTTGGMGGGTTGTTGTTGTADPAKPSTSWTDWLKNNSGWLSQAGQLGVGAYLATKTPKYYPVPLSPEQAALYQQYIKSSNNPATKYNAGIASDLARSELGRVGPTLPWNRTERMSMAYQGLTPPPLSPSGAPGGTNADYYNSIIRQSMANQQKWEGSSGATGTGAGGSTSNYDQSNPPPPPPMGGEGKESSTKKVAKGVLGGLLGGMVTMNPFGAIAGAVTGGMNAKKKKEAAWDESWAPYNAWLAEYGDSYYSLHPNEAPKGWKPSGKTPTTPSTSTGSTGSSPFTTNDPAAGMPWSQSGATPGGLGGWLAQHPEVTKQGPNGIASAISSAFGLPPEIAMKIALAYTTGK